MKRQFFSAVLSAALVVGVGVPLTTYVSDAEARKFSRAAKPVTFQRKVVRNQISLPSAPAQKKGGHKKQGNALTGGFWGSGKKGKQKSIKTKGKGQKVSLTQARSGNTLKTKQALKVQRHQSKFKQKAAPVPGLKTPTGGKAPSRLAQNRAYNKTYQNHAIYNRARNNNPTTYYTRRNSYYDDVGWGAQTPVYVYNSAPSYGLWDTTYLYSSLYNPVTAAQFAYHHQRDADYLRWRAAAEKEALENIELRKQLAAMDAAKAQYAGQPIDPNYLPEGVDADIAMSSGARAASLPEFRVCTGGTDGAYFMLTTGVMAPNAEYVRFVPVVTAGTGETLQYIQQGKCDGGWAQSNGYWNFIEDNSSLDLPFTKLFSPYREATHMICHAKGPSKISQLDEDDHRVLFPTGSGAEVTYRDWIGEDDDYADIPNSLTHPALRVADNGDALLKVSQDPRHNTCMLYVAAAGATEFMRTTELSAKALNVVLIDLNDGDLLDTTDPSGDDVYSKTQIDSSVYPNLSRQAGSFYGSGDIHTLDMNADFLVGEAWKRKHPDIASKMALKVITMEDRIKQVLRP